VSLSTPLNTSIVVLLVAWGTQKINEVIGSNQKRERQFAYSKMRKISLLLLLP